MEEDLFKPDQHLLERPEHIFEIDLESDIKVEKYLTKEERAVKEEEERKRREREELLRKDNVGQRGLKAMMGGTDLVMKKDQNLLESELVREDWMNKPQEEMNDDERQKLKEFE
mmetsp:Transcript_23919/g.16895  ORF Transcript_23919/g.16895 Transcript_23919/m.16895 type:complete len:114 (+) Transcript_23919:2388-2729(+)